MTPASASSALERQFSVISGHFRKERNQLTCKSLLSLAQTQTNDEFKKVLDSLIEKQ